MKKAELTHKIYDVIMGLFAVVCALLVVVDTTQQLKSWERCIFVALYCIFLADYAIRFVRAADKKSFVTHNIWDLVALIPFHGVLPDTGNKRLDAVLSVMGLCRIIGFLSRPLRKAKRFYNTNGFKYVLFATAMTILTGGVLIHYAEGMAFDDGIWWAFVTATTVGYGDISPNTVYGRIIAMVLMLVGIGLIGSVTSTLTSFFLDRKEKTVRGSVLGSIKSELDRFDELTPEEVEEICALLRTMKSKK